MYHRMKRQLIFFLFVLFIGIQGVALSSNSIDSVGVSTKNGKQFIVHEVEAGETLYALSRKYNVDVQSIKDVNDDAINNLSIGQRVLIPITKPQEISGVKVHAVSSSETLFSISRLYGVQVDDLKKWNNLSENSISVGQKLMIKGGTENISNSTPENSEASFVNGKTHTVEQSQTLYSISRMYNVSTDQIIEWNSLSSNSLNIGQVLIVSSGAVTTEAGEANSSMLPVNETASKKETESLSNDAVDPVVGSTVILGASSTDDLDEEIIEKPAEKVIQKGLAEVIEPVSDTKKYLALHRDAPTGTIMQVKNEMNGQSVFVRIVGPIPETGDNAKVILKISKKAYDRLGAIDKRFPVEISFIP